jgi:iron complex outermembrane receptor protein
MLLAGSASILFVQPATAIANQERSQAVPVLNEPPSSAAIDSESENSAQLLPRLSLEAPLTPLPPSTTIANAVSEQLQGTIAPAENSENSQPNAVANAVSEQLQGAIAPAENSENSQPNAVANAVPEQLQGTIAPPENSENSQPNNAVANAVPEQLQGTIAPVENSENSQPNNAVANARSSQIQHPEAIAKIPRLNEIEQPLTAARALAQQPEPSAPASGEAVPEAVKVLGVRVTRSQTGIAVLLETAAGSAIVPVTRTQGNNLIADIPNAVLSLPAGQAFRAEKPIAGISSVVVTQIDATNIRVIVAGEAAAPTAKVESNELGLVLSLSPNRQEEISITVTAEFREESIFEVPVSVTAVTGEEIERSGIRSVQDIAPYVPNLSSFSFQGDRFLGNTTIRGIGNNDLSGLADPSVGVFVDGVPVSLTNNLGMEFFDVERVEVLRGPQSTLYGVNSQGGAINIISRRPTNVWRGQGIASYGSPGIRQNQISFSGPLQPDRLFIGFSGSYSERDGFIRNPLLDNLIDDRQSLLLLPQLRWTPSENWDISFSGSYEQYNDGGGAFVPLDDIETTEFSLNSNGLQTVRVDSQALRVSYKNDRINFTSITARRFQGQDINKVDLDYSPKDYLIARRQRDITQYSQEFRLQSASGQGRPLDWIIGTFFSYKDFEQSTLSTIRPDGAELGLPVGVNNRDQNATLSFRNFAIYSQATYNISEQVSLTAGLRYQNDSKEIDRTRSSFGREGLVTTEINADGTWNQFIPRFAAEYRPNPNLLFYGSIARGYKSGGLSIDAEAPEFVRFEPERNWSYEIGTKYSSSDNRLFAAFALFYTNVNDYQVPRFDPTTLSATLFNAAQVNIWGAEVELKGRPVDGLDLIGTFGYTNAEYSNFRDPITKVSFDGNTPPYVPKYNLSLATQYRSPGGFLGRLEFQVKGQTFFNDENELKQNPYSLVNARIGYEKENFGVYLYAQNLLDRIYVLDAVQAGFGRDFFVGTPGDRRTWGVEVKLQF